jgi:hypothetical protein
MAVRPYNRVDGFRIRNATLANSLSVHHIRPIETTTKMLCPLQRLRASFVRSSGFLIVIFCHFVHLSGF